MDQVVFAGYIQGCAMALRGLAGVKQDIDVLLSKRIYPTPPGEEGPDLWTMADLFSDMRRFRLLKMAEEAQTLLAMR